jgi:glyoxylate/hydroxypyruvate reductase A
LRSVLLQPMKIYVHTILSESFQEELRESLVEHELYFRRASSDLSNDRLFFEKADYLFGNPPVAWFQGQRRFRFWQIDSAGFDQYREVEVEAEVANMGDWFAIPCAETIVGGIVALYRGLPACVLLRNEGKWVGAKMRERLGTLHGKKVMVLGVGTIGTAVRALLTAFGCQVKSFARTSSEAEILDREELYRELASTDLVVNTLPGTAEYIVDGTFLTSMKDGSTYANVGRGSTTDEPKLIEALRSGKLSGAVLDVTEVEPLPGDSPLWTLPNVILTQHTAGGRANEDSGKVTLFIKNMRRFERGEEIENRVDITRGY